MRDLRGQTAVITGGARRLGRAITLALAQAGCNVVIDYHTSADAAERTAAEARGFGVAALPVRADVTRAAEVQHLLDTAVGAFGAVHILVANAGVFRRTPIDTLTDDEWDAMLSTNLRATFLCAHRFGLHMRAHAGGAIVCLADVAGIQPWRGYLPYSVAKAGVIALTRGLAKELAPSVRVNAIAPGPVLFPEGFDEAAQAREIARTVLQRPGAAGDVADAALMLVRSDYITGALLPVDGGRLLT